RSIAAEVTACPVRDTSEVEAAMTKLGREPGRGLIVPPDAFTLVHQHLFIRLAQEHRVPAVYYLRRAVAQGALMSYGPDPIDLFRRSASYVDRILKGASRLIFPFSSQRSSNWPSILRPPRRSASKFQTNWLPLPTR